MFLTARHALRWLATCKVAMFFDIFTWVNKILFYTLLMYANRKNKHEVRWALSIALFVVVRFSHTL